MNYLLIFFCLITTISHYFYNNIFIFANENEKNINIVDLTTGNIDYFKPGYCKKLWRRDRLVGKCFGLKDHNEFPELKHITKVRNVKDCRSICCNLGDQCVTWQYQNSTQTCKLGPPVRLGFESAGTGDWCDPHPPQKWTGSRLTHFGKTCEFGEELPNQCFGLGPEQLNSTKGALSAVQCRELCCSSPACNIWQHMEGRGCYMGSSKDAWCDQPQGAYDGGRKCIPNFCGGLENEILPMHKKYLENIQRRISKGE